LKLQNEGIKYKVLKKDIMEENTGTLDIRAINEKIKRG
jgi:hypothetical protein